MNALENKIRDSINWGIVWAEADARPLVTEIFDQIVTVLKRTPQFKDSPRDQLDLLLADCRNKAEWDLGGVVDGTIVIEDMIHDIVEGLAP